MLHINLNLQDLLVFLEKDTLKFIKIIFNRLKVVLSSNKENIF